MGEKIAERFLSRTACAKVAAVVDALPFGLDQKAESIGTVVLMRVADDDIAEVERVQIDSGKILTKRRTCVEKNGTTTGLNLYADAADLSAPSVDGDFHVASPLQKDMRRMSCIRTEEVLLLIS